MPLNAFSSTEKLIPVTIYIFKISYIEKNYFMQQQHIYPVTFVTNLSE